MIKSLSNYSVAKIILICTFGLHSHTRKTYRIFQTISFHESERTLSDLSKNEGPLGHISRSEDGGGVLPRRINWIEALSRMANCRETVQDINHLG